ncbi:hypothetical protein [Pseudomonas aeruginosa]|uniref:hypothetical protein n=1 Tax=Pseudomonas aeruginosa TaxID=287 RepID=UPI00259CB308|nr:hypothetical protein [Pseudomonas aeruginosa]EKX2272305.1 hypothetical protein [Pseudomonas aeruginosa]MDM4786327.1 hypothetical protein [Pseudomonas aeruginosa]MDM4794225.1 hypothetical protein [Pseudomonas aeruginosa]MDM4842284.1 hypothetical protein [Pseudomonas aeruginosa]MDM4850741.1 hypothetical protein [Pseudomonas aeruginosa]
MLQFFFGALTIVIPSVYISELTINAEGAYAMLRKLHPQSRAAGLPGFPGSGYYIEAVMPVRTFLQRISAAYVNEMAGSPFFKLFSNVRHGQDSHMGVRLNWGGLLLAGKADAVIPESQQNQ